MKVPLGPQCIPLLLHESDIKLMGTLLRAILTCSYLLPFSVNTRDIDVAIPINITVENI